MGFNNIFVKIICFALLILAFCYLVFSATTGLLATIQDRNETSHNFGSANLIDPFANLNVFDGVDLSNADFIPDASSGTTNVYTATETFDEVIHFDSSQPYNMLVNNTPCNFTQASGYQVMGTFKQSFYDVNAHLIMTVTVFISFQFYVNHLSIVMTTTTNQTGYDLLMTYILANGFNARVIEGQFNSTPDPNATVNITFTNGITTINVPTMIGSMPDIPYNTLALQGFMLVGFNKPVAFAQIATTYFAQYDVAEGYEGFAGKTFTTFTWKHQSNGDYYYNDFNIQNFSFTYPSDDSVNIYGSITINNVTHYIIGLWNIQGFLGTLGFAAMNTNTFQFQILSSSGVNRNQISNITLYYSQPI